MNLRFSIAFVATTVFASFLLCAPVFADSPAAGADLISVEVTGRVVSSDGIPASGASVHFGLSKGKLDEKVTADDDGKFRLSIKLNQAALPAVIIRSESANGKQLAVGRFTVEGESVITDDVEIKLLAGKTGSVRVLDAGGVPVAGAKFAVQLEWPNTMSGLRTDEDGIATFRYPENERVQTVVAWKDGMGLDYRVYALSRQQRSDAMAKN